MEARVGEPRGPLALPQAVGQPLRDRQAKRGHSPLGIQALRPRPSLPPSLDLYLPLGSGSLSAASRCEFSGTKGALVLEFETA